jgi:hypothetical protein
MTKDAKQLQEALDGFTGTEAYHRLTMSRTLVATDGVAFLANAAGCFWLMDIIASYQPRCAKDPSLRDFQLWRLVRHDPPLQKGGQKVMATVYCDRDKDDTAFSQDIPYTDFPLPSLKLYVEAGECGGKAVMVVMLPNER